MKFSINTFMIKFAILFVPFLAFFTNTLFPGTGISNAIILVCFLCLFVLFWTEKFVIILLLCLIISLIFLLTDLQSLSARDISAAISISILVTILLSPLQIQKIHRNKQTITNSINFLFYISLCLFVVEYLAALQQRTFTKCSLLPRASAPLRSDFIFGDIAGCAYDPNNAGMLIVLFGIAASGSIIKFRDYLLVSVASGSRAVIISGFFGLTWSNKILIISGSLIIALLFAPLIPEAILSRFDFAGEIEQSGIERIQVMLRAFAQLELFATPDHLWVRSEGQQSFRSNYNLFLSLSLMFGIIYCALVIGVMFLSVIIGRINASTSVIIFISSMTAEYLFNFFIVFGVALVVLRAQSDKVNFD